MAASSWPTSSASPANAGEADVIYSSAAPNNIEPAEFYATLRYAFAAARRSRWPSTSSALTCWPASATCTGNERRDVVKFARSLTPEIEVHEGYIEGDCRRGARQGNRWVTSKAAAAAPGTDRRALPPAARRGRRECKMVEERRPALVANGYTHAFCTPYIWPTYKGVRASASRAETPLAGKPTRPPASTSRSCPAGG